ncbi:AIR1 (YIL079C) and AIR2 (YDL175C) [Zygosaccharomyces parabailii]|uniref:ZYBA0S04-02366g1_1 n=1 Tax=Zygosaccharomyces bailii (strain CLIB 213 / ATCC 58445 / CBS 680 / BCRC 21525 / NBRC 1098 / NCYC 1416 / NRRL Y-2227) TaxID=1333698 RepID=A0A8J2T681_ZYGB2|nr:AIR1 (YIL079C) and AIR2 (YDL175C) [Zygosaccharomyces parabailii]AQZ14520.1 AIR1 (YIL079C) and AIR2 (YDL175C) [Zygosaccharomyces parabailii]CDF89358.1 ZYBA0S04-02366g1_1 [Zygosaccharomyces bailii CLIB 213]CDH08319.1 related to Protein AIR2 [Zygosaccharomyces bailii ISA1307]SJM85739.1 related to protein AIR2 [Zygosaccharomyces bailii]
MSMLSEFETMDTLPFVKDATPPVRDKVAAPTIDEVDADPEGLRTMRGQGRYFGVNEEDGIKEAEPKCNNCSQRGHLKRNCPHVICSYCGAMDDHYSQHCLKAIKCSNCNESGHYRSQCPQKWKRVFCTLCNSKRHSRDRCPSVWRVYLLKDESNKRMLPMHAFFCYNCGGKGHMGDECDARRSSRVPNDDGSAFSGDNLSLPLKREYFQNLQRQWRDRSREDNFDYNAYEFDNALYDDEPSNGNRKKSKSKKRKHQNSHQSSNKRNKSPQAVQPVQRGGTLPSARSRVHPLDFPRNSNSNNRNASSVTRNMDNSRYGRSGSQRNQGHKNYKSHNSYKPFRSGTLNIRR